MKVLTVPELGQHDNRWGNQRHGTMNGVTIAAEGCTISCLTMKNLYYGGSGLVNNIDDIFTNQGGYVRINAAGRVVGRSPQNGCNILDWSKVPSLLPLIKLDSVGYYTNVPADLNKIRASIDAGHPVTCEVRWHGVRTAMHFVEVTGYDGDDMICNDPETGRQQRFSSKLFGTGKSETDILTAHFFTGPLPTLSEPDPAAVNVTPINPENQPMTADQEKQAYEIVLGREPEQTTGRSAMQFILDAQDEMTNQREAQAKALAEAQMTAKLAQDTLEKQSGTITSLTSELNALKPEYERTESLVEQGTEWLTRSGVAVVDFADKKPPVWVEANALVTEYSRFMVAGHEYVRSDTSAAIGDRYGFPIEALRAYSGPASDPIATEVNKMVLTAAQSAHQAAAGSLGLWRKFTNLFGGKK